MGMGRKEEMGGETKRMVKWWITSRGRNEEEGKEEERAG